jgi:DHA1 family bicyclomycin/chloramphenicol resistance-like MFS transporter
MTNPKDSFAFLILLVFLSMVGPLTLNILVPSLPGMVDSLAAPKEQVQLTLSLYLLGMGISQLVLGPLADRFGRRPVVLVALITYIAASFFAFAAPNVEILIVARILQSFGATAGLTLARTMIRDIYGRDAAASRIGYVTMAMVLAPMIAPILGAIIDDFFGWRAILLFCAALGALAVIIGGLNLPETRPPSLVAVTWGEVVLRTIELGMNLRFLGFWGTSTFCSGIFFAFLGAAPYLMIEVLGRPKTEYGFWFMSLSIGYMAGNFISGRFAERIGLETLIGWGNTFGLAGAAAFLAMAFAGWLSPMMLFLPAMVTSFGNGLVLPNAIAGGLGVDAKAAGAGSGMMGFGQMGLGAVMSYLGGKIVDGSALPLATLMMICAVLALIAGIFARRPEPDNGKPL